MDDALGVVVAEGVDESLRPWDGVMERVDDSLAPPVAERVIACVCVPLAEEDGACVGDTEGVKVKLGVAVDDAVAVGEGGWLAVVDGLRVPVQLDEPVTLAVADSEAERDRVTLGLELGDGDDEEERVPEVVGVAPPEDDVVAVRVRLVLPVTEGVAVIDCVCVGVEMLLDEPVDVGVSVRVIEAVSVGLGVVDGDCVTLGDTVRVCVRLGVAVGVCDDVCVKLGVKLWDVVCAPTSSSPLKKGQRVANGAGSQPDTPVPNAPIEDRAVVS